MTAGATVVDIGCGAGMDLLLAAQSVGPGAELVVLLGRVGFDDVVVKERFDCFRETSKERVAKKYGVVGVNVYARKSR